MKTKTAAEVAEDTRMVDGVGLVRVVVATREELIPGTNKTGRRLLSVPVEVTDSPQNDFPTPEESMRRRNKNPESIPVPPAETLATEQPNYVTRKRGRPVKTGEVSRMTKWRRMKNQKGILFNE